MIKTYGLTHIALALRDPDVSLRFYERVFGLQEYGRDDCRIHVRSPAGRDVITFVKEPSFAGRAGGVMHFGFRLQAPGEIDGAVQEVEHAGGRILRRGEFGPGLPFVYVSDPDGYEVEIWGSATILVETRLRS